MTISLDKWASNLAKRPLPALAVTIHRVRQLLEDPNTSNLDFQAVIGLDPGFTLDIYRNFGMSPAGKHAPASNVAHAISLLGPLPVKIALKHLPTLDKDLPEAAEIGIYQCYAHAAHAAIYAKDIGEQRGDNNPDEMGHAALLHNCAEMALWTYASKPMQMIHTLVGKGADYGSASSSVLGFTLEQLSAKLINKWNLSPLITETMDHTWFDRERSMAVVIASTLARASAAGWYSNEVYDITEFLAEYQHHSNQRTAAYIHSMAAIAGRKLRGLHLPVTAHSMLQQPPVVNRLLVEEKQKQLQEKFKERSLAEYGKELLKQHYTDTRNQEGIKAPRETQRESLKEFLKEHPMEAPKRKLVVPREKPPVAERPAAKPKMQPSVNPATVQTKPAARAKENVIATERIAPPHEWLKSLQDNMRAMRNGLGLQQVVFAMLSQDKKRAGVGYLMGVAANSGLYRFAVNLEQINLFSMLLSKQQGFWLKPDNQEKFLPMIPNEVGESIDKRGFFCMSIFVSNQPVGFVYADGRDAMNTESYTEFKQICADLSLDLEKSR
jgi:HD-like signal output (HDOD) protein